MKQPAITVKDLECLEHLRNVGQFVGELMQVQDCTSLRRDPTQQLQLTSVIYLMTAQLDGVVERCKKRWLTCLPSNVRRSKPRLCACAPITSGKSCRAGSSRSLTARCSGSR